MTDEVRDTNIEITYQGPVRVNAAHIHKAREDVVCIYIDMHSKYAVVDCSISGEGDPPAIFMSANKRTLHVDESKSMDESTCIEFTDYPGWRVFAADVSRYAVAVCLVRD